MTWHKVIGCIALLIAMAAAACGYYHIVPKAIDADHLASLVPEQMRTGPSGTGPGAVAAPRIVVRRIDTPTKAHLKDGSVVLFPGGFRIGGNLLSGEGEKYNLTRQTHAPVQTVPLQDVAALEHYEKDLRPVLSNVTTIPAIIVGFTAAIGIAVAAFGSCPTVYSPAEYNGRLLEAELFSHSIGQRFESDDLDILTGARLRNGGYHVQIANEALETHYINNLTLETVDHQAGSRAYPTPDDQIIVVEGETAVTARSSQGKDVTAALTARDETAYRTDPALTRTLLQNIAEDWVELNVRIPATSSRQRPVLTLRVRNTLMATVLFYDVMLRSQGIQALTWLGSDTSNPLYAWRIARWFDRSYSLRVETWDGRRFAHAGSVSPTGPIAWHDVAIELPPLPGPEARVRIFLLPDNWMIDYASVGVRAAQQPDVRVTAATGADGLPSGRAEDVLSPLRAKDRDYLITSPGENHILFFPAGPPAPGTLRTAFLRSRGFYIEWLREAWFKDAEGAASGPSFEPGDEAIKETVRLWLQKKEDLERQFFATKVPIAGGTR